MREAHPAEGRNMLGGRGGRRPQPRASRGSAESNKERQHGKRMRSLQSQARIGLDFVDDGQTVKIMRPGRNWATKEQTYLWQTGSSNFNCSGSMRQIWTPLRINHLQVSYEVVLEAHDIPRPKSGDLLVNRFWGMQNMIVDSV
jgi:hypothetical protein